ncbi:MAG: tetratricopeptide repeat protein [Bacillota bacterium]
MTKRIRSKYEKLAATREFVDREDFLRAFDKALTEIRLEIERKVEPKYRVLVYYGVGGIGKTSLRKELGKRLDNTVPPVYWTVLDFEESAHRETGNALCHLRNSLRDKYKIQFPTFDLAYAVYWRKAHPQIPLSKETFSFMEEGGIVADIVSVLGDLPVVGLIPKVTQALGKGHRFFREWWTKRGKEELRDLPEMELKDIKIWLPKFFGDDLKDFLSRQAAPAVFFIDSYEALWESGRTEGRLFDRDEWVRDLVDYLPEVLWVISGREMLRWEEADPEFWEGCITQHLVGALTDTDAGRFLDSCGIENEDIKGTIIKGSEGVPFYLDVSVDHYFNIKDRKNREPSVEDFGRTPREVTDRFLRYLDVSETETLKVLATARFWNKHLFEALVTHFKTGYPVTRLSDLSRFSFVETEKAHGMYRMHQLMRTGLQERLKNQDPELYKKVHEFLFNHYRDQLKTIDIKNITATQKNAFREAFYHVQKVLAAEELFAWFSETGKYFNDAAQWEFLVPLYEECLDILTKALGPEHPDVAMTLDDLACIYRALGKYAEAEPLCQRALAIEEKALGPEHLDVATTLNNLALLYYSQERYAEAEPLYRRALAIKEQALGPEHPDVAATLNNLAELYRLQERYAEAEPLYRRALALKEQALGPEHPHVATTLNNLALLYYSQERYTEAEPLYRRALALKEQALGPEHPHVATTLNNLALLYYSQERYTEAEPLYQRALALYEKALGPEHPHVAAALNNLAGLYRSQGKYAEAEPLYRRALALYEKALGPEHPHVAAALNNLVGLYRSQGKYAEAEPLYRRALAIFREALSPEHPDTVTALQNYNRLLEELKQRGES